ncbi:MAG: helix-turn-helix domain-containing protein [Methyloprofundus sp.]|nr:helix-turn-helix domain-containing protein [Methyloprofundus sp.]
MSKNELKEARKLFNLTPKEMAETLNTPVRTYEGWEQGRKIPGIVSVTLELLRKHANP